MIHAGRGIYAGDPEPAKIAFPLSPIPVSVHEGFIDRISRCSK
jgi:hypothetical protein